MLATSVVQQDIAGRACALCQDYMYWRLRTMIRKAVPAGNTLELEVVRKI